MLRGTVLGRIGIKALTLIQNIVKWKSNCFSHSKHHESLDKHILDQLEDGNATLKIVFKEQRVEAAGRMAENGMFYQMKVQEATSDKRMG